MLRHRILICTVLLANGCMHCDCSNKPNMYSRQVQPLLLCSDLCLCLQKLAENKKWREAAFMEGIALYYMGKFNEAFMVYCILCMLCCMLLMLCCVLHTVCYRLDTLQ